ncbi:hypothetical protein KAH55_01195, partial [bacterium]|nr:hypothetical protein [bacterium]
MLIITDDYNSVHRCRNLDEVAAVADTLISLRPDVVTLDSTAPDTTKFISKIGQPNPSWSKSKIYEFGNQPMQIMIERLRTAGIQVLANIRMNDHHGREELWTPWEQEHVEWSLGTDNGDRGWRAISRLRHMDYTQPGVREHRLAILDDLLTTIPYQGLQLDFNRTIPFVSSPKKENGRWLTEYIRDVRQLVFEKCGAEGKLGVLVPWDLELCLAEGMNVPEWIKNGLIDYVSPGEWYYSDWNLSFGKWKALTGNTSCQLIPYTPGNVSPYQPFERGEQSLLGDNSILDLPKIRAIADNFQAQDLDGLALYNFYTFDFGAIYPEVHDALNTVKNCQAEKHYFFCRETVYHGDEYISYDQGTAFARHSLNRVGETVNFFFQFNSPLKATTQQL